MSVPKIIRIKVQQNVTTIHDFEYRCIMKLLFVVDIRQKMTSIGSSQEWVVCTSLIHFMTCQE